MAKQQISAPLIKEPKNPITKPKLRFQKTKNIEYIATSIDCSFINLRTKRGISVFVYIRPISKVIDKLLEPGIDKQDYRFEGIDSEELRENFLKATGSIKPINYVSLNSDVHLYLYSIGNKRRIYNITESLYIEHIS